MANRLKRMRDDDYEPGNNFYGDDADNFDGLYANLPVNPHTATNDNLPPPASAVLTSDAIQRLSLPMTREEEDRRITEFLIKSEADWDRYLKTGVRPGVRQRRGRERGRGVDYYETYKLHRQPPAGYVCHRCGAPEDHYIQHCPTNGDPEFDNFYKLERKVIPMKKNIVNEPDEKAFQRAIKGIPTLENSAEAEDIANPPTKSTPTTTAVPSSSSETIEEIQQQDKTGNMVYTNVPAGNIENGFNRNKPFPGYVCHRCRTPDDHFIRDCPTNGDPAYDNYTRPSSKPSSTSFVQATINHPVGQLEETQQQDKTGNLVDANVPAGNKQNGYIRNKPFPGYVCHRCRTPDDHFIRDCPTNGDPAYDNYIRSAIPAYQKSGVTHESVVRPCLRPSFNYNVVQGYPNPAQGFPPVQHNSWQVRGESFIQNNGCSLRRTHHPNNAVPLDQSRNVNAGMQGQMPNQQLHQVPPGNEYMGAPPVKKPRHDGYDR